jgi:hypothetical protein
VSAELSIQFDQVGLQRAIDDLEKTKGATGLTVRWLCWDQMRLAMLDAVKYTAPRTESGGSFAEQKRIGSGAATADIDQVFARTNNPAVVLFENRGKQMGRIISSGAVFEIPAELWKPNLEALHKRLRNRRGRTPRKMKQAWVVAKDLKAYQKAVVGRVGSLKAGWLAGLRMFGSLTGGKTSVPKWIESQMVEGTSEDRLSESGNGWAKASNTAHHNIAIRRDMVDFIEGKRNKDINVEMKLRMERIAERFNAGQAKREVVA